MTRRSRHEKDSKRRALAAKAELRRRKRIINQTQRAAERYNNRKQES